MDIMAPYIHATMPPSMCIISYTQYLYNRVANNVVNILLFVHKN